MSCACVVDGAMYVYCKGSFEKVKGLCDSTSLPPMYDEVPIKVLSNEDGTSISPTPTANVVACRRLQGHMQWTVATSLLLLAKNCQRIPLQSRSWPCNARMWRVHLL